MSIGTVDIRPYSAKYAHNIFPVLEAALGQSSTRSWDANYWQWKHHVNPAGESFGVVALDDNNARCAGVRVMMQWQLSRSGEYAVQAARAVDTATHPDYQRRGLFTRMTMECLQQAVDHQHQMIFNTPNNNSLPGYLKMGWALTQAPHFYLKLVNPLRILRRASDIEHSGVYRIAHIDEPQFRVLMSLVSSHEQCRTSLGLRTPRTESFLRWRYMRHPGVEYWLVVLDADGDSWDAAAIVRLGTRRGLRECVISEVFARDADPGHLRRLYRRVARVMPCDYVVTLFSADGVERKQLIRAGFFPVYGKKLNIVANVLQPDLFRNQIPHFDMSYGELELM